MTAGPPSRWKRRDALKLGVVGGAGAAAAALGVAGTVAAREVERKGECRFCTMHCGTLATVRAGRVTSVRGDPEARTRGFLCAHGRALPEVINGDARLSQPWNCMTGGASWERAFDDIGGRLRALRDAHGPESLAVMTGWPFVRHPMIHLLHRFCRAYGTPNLATVASLCEAAGRMGRTLLWGRSYTPDLDKVQTLLVWGADPPRTAPPFGFLVARARTLVVVDPVKTELAKNAHRWVRVRPGTDAAFALGLIRAVFDAGLQDEAFLAAHTVNVASLRQLVEPWTPQRTAEVTGCGGDDVTAVAALFARAPAGVWDGLGVEHHKDGVDTARAISALVAVCGHKDAQRFERADPLLRIEQQGPVPPAPSTPPLGVEEHSLFCALHRQAHASALWPGILDGRVRGLVCFGANPALTSPDSALVRRALAKLDLAVVVDPFFSETAALAHWALPAASFAEGTPGDGPAVVPPQGDSRTDADILFSLARACGLGAYFPWRGMAEAFRGPRTVVDDKWASDIVAAQVPRFGDPIDLSFPCAVPSSAPPSGAGVDGAGPAFPLRLVTGPRQRAYINSQFHEVRAVARLLPRPLARLHPAHGVADGAPVVVETARGRATFFAEVTEDVAPDVVVVPHGWPGDADANRLTSWDGRDPISGFPELRALACRLVSS